MDDLQIIELYFERNEDAIQQTDAKYGKLCHRIAYNILHSREDSQECVNDTYMGAWNAIPPTRPRNLMAFLCKIARNLSLKRLEYLTREKRSAEMEVALEELEAILPDDRYARDADGEELGQLISSFLRTQKKEARDVFIRKYFFFDSVKEIADRYSLTESKVKNMLLRTRNRLKEYLIQEGVAL